MSPIAKWTQNSVRSDHYAETGGDTPAITDALLAHKASLYDQIQEIVAIETASQKCIPVGDWQAIEEAEDAGLGGVTTTDMLTHPEPTGLIGVPVKIQHHFRSEHVVTPGIQQHQQQVVGRHRRRAAQRRGGVDQVRRLEIHPCLTKKRLAVAG